MPRKTLGAIYRPYRHKVKSKSGKITHYDYWLVTYSEDGKRKRRMVQTEGEAKNLRDEFNKVRKKVGESFFALGNLEIVDAQKALGMRRKAGQPDLSLEDAMRIALEAGKQPEKIVRVTRVIDEYLEEAKNGTADFDCMRPASYKDLRLRLNCFKDAFQSFAISTVDRKIANKWLNGLRKKDGSKYNRQSLRNYRMACSGLFAFAVDNEYVAENPFHQTRRARRKNVLKDDKDPLVFTVKQVETLMAKARDETPEIVPALAISFFAGVRTAELFGLRWEKHIDLDNGYIKITGDIAKKRSRRDVEIQPNLKAWLQDYRKQSGPVTPTKTAYRYRRNHICKETGIGWLHNAPRHTFASCLYRKTGNANKVMEALGHKEGSDVFDKHYKTLVFTEADAKKYFKIVPDRKGKIVQLHTA